MKSRIKYNTEAEAIGITPVGKRKHQYIMGTVMLRDVFFLDGYAIGEVVSEAVEVMEPSHPALYRRLVPVRFVGNRILTIAPLINDVIDVTDGHFSVAYFCGSTAYVGGF